MTDAKKNRSRDQKPMLKATKDMGLEVGALLLEKAIAANKKSTNAVANW